MVTVCSFPDFPAKVEADGRAVDLGVLVLRVVKPNEPFDRAYSSLPTRISVVSNSRMMVARTFVRGIPVCLRSRRMWRRMRANAVPKAAIRPYFVLIPNFPPTRVIPILLAASRIAAGGLEMSVRNRTNPNVFPCGRNDKRANPPQGRRIGDCLAVGVCVVKTFPGAMPADARAFIADIAKLCRLGIEDRIVLTLEPPGCFRSLRPAGKSLFTDDWLDGHCRHVRAVMQTTCLCFCGVLPTVAQDFAVTSGPAIHSVSEAARFCGRLPQWHFRVSASADPART